MKSLEGQVAVVAGATRGAGRGIAWMLGEAGATVYCTGRSVRGHPAMGNRPETLEETAEGVTARGGQGICAPTDHLDPAQVQALFERVKQEQDGRLDLLVNDIWGGDPITEWDTPFWKHSLENGLQMQRTAVHTHLITSYYGVPLMVARGRGLVIEITDGDDLVYRGNLYYDLAKISTIRLGLGMAEELRPFGITALALTPGFLRSEAMLDHFGVCEENWRDAVAQEPHFIESETPFFVGKAVAALAADPKVHEKSGKVLASWNLAREYGFRDVDGRQPHWGEYFAAHVKQPTRLEWLEAS